MKKGRAEDRRLNGAGSEEEELRPRQDAVLRLHRRHQEVGRRRLPLPIGKDTPPTVLVLKTGHLKHLCNSGFLVQM